VIVAPSHPKRKPTNGRIKMSERMLEELREYKAMLERLIQIEGFLDNCEWEHFTVEDARKCVNHIRNGGGWL